MQKVVRKTGDYGIGIMIHSVHMTDDVPTLNKFYEEVFGGLMFMGVDEPNFLPVEDRWAGLIQISDFCVETMAPNLPADPTKPVGKFYSKFGKHLHSVGYKVDDLVGLSPNNHGTLDAVAVCIPDCAPSIWQQRPNAEFMAALNSSQETFPGISYTSVFTLTDEVVVPNFGNTADAGGPAAHVRDGLCADARRRGKDARHVPARPRRARVGLLRDRRSGRRRVCERVGSTDRALAPPAQGREVEQAP